MTAPPSPNKRTKWLQLLLYLTLATVGRVGGPLSQRLYYTHGGSRKWLMCFLQSAGFPILLIPLTLLHAKPATLPLSSPSSSSMEPRLALSAAALGLVSGLVNYMYSSALHYLPVTTLSLLYSTQLAFVSVLSFFMVRQRFTFYSVNAVVLLTLGAVVLGLRRSGGGDRGHGVTQGMYLFGFFVALGAAAASGVLLVGIELAYKRSRRPVNVIVVTKFQFVLNLLGTLFCTVGMLVNRDFQIIPKEATEYELGRTKYYFVLVACGLLWQSASVGFIGLVHCTSSLFVGITNALLLPVLQIAAVIAFNEKFTGEKGMCLALCLWGFTSYFIGKYKKSQNEISTAESNQESA
ncbi:hypothetical protein Sjap_012921 [Stephania japonica]|uniref:Probable purine permease n=1 Tax=Stephania japonica TaxID=461633 RepID=A0AAP0IWZ6_9MAGN